MNIYFAPLEGLTDRIYRNLHQQYFPSVDRYYTPFFSPTMHHCLTGKESRELTPASTLSVCTIPQILTKVADDFTWMAQKCAQLGYTEVNLNAGCPSGTVTAKGKGAGMLADSEGLDRFLDSIFSSAPLPISVKTRIGIEKPEEFEKILGVYNQYPIKELIIHPRVRKAFYAGDVHMESFRHAVQYSKNPVCYNGDLQSLDDIDTLKKAFPQVKSAMVGRGLIARPDMLCKEAAGTDKLVDFYETLLEEYLSAFGGAKNAMFRLKEHWHYLLPCFEGSEKLGKQLRKTTILQEYRNISKEILHLKRI